MRLIDADKLSEHKFTRESAKSSDYMRGWNDCIDTIIDNAPTVDTYTEDDVQEAIKAGYQVGYELPKAKFERPQGKWIPVSERLPEEKMFNPSGSDFFFDFEEVLCTTIWGDVRAYKFGKPIGHDKPHFWFGARIMDEYVIAWQYKPEPYKEAKDEKG